MIEQGNSWLSCCTSYV